MSSLAHLLNPIGGDNPAGQDIRYGPVYDAIKDARRKEHDASQEERQDKRKEARYDAVVRIASEALEKQSKDLWVAAWLVEALTYEEGFSGLASGLEYFSQLLERYWDCIYPPVEDGDLEDRAAPLLWAGNYFEPAKNSSPTLAVYYTPITASGLSWLHVKEAQEVAKARRSKEGAANAEGKTPEQVEAAIAATPKQFCRDTLAELDASLQQLAALGDLSDRLFGKEAPSYAQLRRTLEDIRQYVQSALERKLEKEPDPVAAPTRPEPVAGPPGGTGQGLGVAPALDPLATTAIPVGSLAEAMAAVVVAAAHWRQAEPGNPAPYLIVRALRWGELRANGESLGAAVQPAPPPQVRVQLKQLATAGQWKELLDATEAATAAEYGRAWLDPQRYAVKACEQLGLEFVARAIKSELKCLLADYPALPVSVLADDTGAANPETTAWLVDALRWNKD